MADYAPTLDGVSAFISRPHTELWVGIYRDSVIPFTYRPHTELWVGIYRDPVAVPLHGIAAAADISDGVGFPYQPVIDGATANISATKRCVVALEASSLTPGASFSTGDTSNPVSFVYDGTVSAAFTTSSPLLILVQYDYVSTADAIVGVTLASDIEVVAQQSDVELGSAVFQLGVTSHKVIALEASSLIPAQVLAEPASEYIIEIYRNESR